MVTVTGAMFARGPSGATRCFRRWRVDPALRSAELTLFPSLRWSEYWWPLAVEAGRPSEGSAMAIDLPGGMRLARGAFDVGLLTTDIDPMIAFWHRERRLPIERIFEPTPGVTQYKLTMHGAVMKVNHVAGGASQAPRLERCASCASSMMRSPTLAICVTRTGTSSS